MDTADRYAPFPHLRFDRPSDGVLRITLDGPGLNAVDHDVHRELADVWLAVDRDPDTRVALIQGAGRAFSAGGSFELLDDDRRLRGADPGHARGPRPRVQRHQLRQADRVGHARPRGGRGAGGAGSWPTCRSSGAPPGSSTATRRLGVAAGDHAAICWPLLCGMAKAKYYLLTCDTLTGEEAERIGLVSLCVDDEVVQERALEVAVQLAAGAQSAIRWTKQTLNHWYRAQAAILDASLAYEFLGFGGPDAAEGLASHREKRDPRFTGPTSE